MTSICPYCRESIHPGERQVCPSCQTPHHVACWQENRGCTVFGCPQAPPDEPKISLATGAPHSPTTPAAPDLGGAARYLISRNGQQFGPYTLEELHRYLQEGRLQGVDQVWKEGLPAWIPLSQLLRGSGPVAARPARMPPPVSSSATNVAARPATYMLSAVLVTLLCCVPFGIVSIVYASQVDAKFAAGDYAGAQAASNNARNWYHTALAAGILLALGYLAVTLANR